MGMLQDSRKQDLDKSAAYKIFNWRFMCRVNQVQFMPDWLSKHYGIVAPDQSKGGYNDENMDVYLTAVDIALLLGRGVDVTILEPEASVVIYELVDTHLMDWATHLKQARFIPYVPMEDLKLLDDLATICWSVARNYITTEVGVGHRLGVLQRFMTPQVRPGSKAATMIEKVDTDHNSHMNDLLRLGSKSKQSSW